MRLLLRADVARARAWTWANMGMRMSLRPQRAALASYGAHRAVPGPGVHWPCARAKNAPWGPRAAWAAERHFEGHHRRLLAHVHVDAWDGALHARVRARARYRGNARE